MMRLTELTTFATSIKRTPQYFLSDFVKNTQKYLLE